MAGALAPGHRQRLGRAGEEQAAAWYQDHGYLLLDRNWRGPAGELDLVAGRRGQVVFCEVKTRSSTAFGLPAEAVGRAKQARLRHLAVQWLEGHPAQRRSRLRFDVVSVLAGAIEVLEGAF